MRSSRAIPLNISLKFVEETGLVFKKKAQHTLGASSKELCAVLDEVPWDVHELLELFRHNCEVV